MKSRQPMEPYRPLSALILGLGLLALVVVAYAGALGNGFIEDFDDHEYVSRNPYVQAGLTADAARWALTAYHSNNWHPLTWLSLQLDTTLFGTAPLGYHLTNVLLHATATLLLFAGLRRMTGATGRSAVIAALFAVHPLHVESVAWVAERKDVLSAVFWMLTLWLYARYAQAPSLGRYGLVVGAFCLGLAAKPMLVTLPFVLLLLDYWPLGRFRLAKPAEWPAGTDCKPASVGRLVVEKAPLLALALACSAVTLAAQQRIVQSWELFPLPARIINALMSYVIYLYQVIVPTRLAIFYPHSGVALPWWQGALAAMLLLAVTGVAMWKARRRPYLIVGWLWYLGTLVPVIGLVQVGVQAHADRYTYLPLVGIFVMIAWGLYDLATRRPGMRTALPWTAAAAVTACLVLTVRQVSYWHDSMTLWRHALDVTTGNHLAHGSLGVWLVQEGKLEEARRHFRKAIELLPQSAGAYASLGLIYSRQGDLPRAVECYREALKYQPDLAEVQIALGLVLLRQGEEKEGLAALKETTRLRPTDAGTQAQLGNIYASLARWDDAREHLAAALHLLQEQGEGESPAAAQLCNQLARALRCGGKPDEALPYYRRAVALDPGQPFYRCGLAYLLKDKGQEEAARREYQGAFRRDASWPRAAIQAAHDMATASDPFSGDGPQAVELAVGACAVANPTPADFLDVLAAAYAAVGRFEDAVSTARTALRRADATGQAGLARQIEQRLALYEKRQPYRAPRP